MRNIWGTIKRHKIWAALGVLLLGAGVITGGIATYDRILTSKDCTSIERFDFIDNSCYFECDTDQECDALSKKVNDEIDKRFVSSKAVVSKEKKPTEPVSAAPKPVGELYTKATTGSETNGTVYTVQPDGTLLPSPSASHRALWDVFSKIVSKAAVTKSIASFEVYKNSSDSSAASVWRSNDPMKWHMNVNEAYTDNRADLIHTLVHEYGHIVTLSGDQIIASGTCPRLQLEEGCAKEGSYSNGFYEAFWKKYGRVSSFGKVYAYHETDPADANSQYPTDQSMPEDYNGEISNQSMPTEEPAAVPEPSRQEIVGSGDPNEFVTEYAASNIGEDLAESFAYFVLRPKPTGTFVKDEKVNYFYQFSELVNLRNRIRVVIGSDILQRNRMIRH